MAENTLKKIQEMGGNKQKGGTFDFASSNAKPIKILELSFISNVFMIAKTLSLRKVLAYQLERIIHRLS